LPCRECQRLQADERVRGYFVRVGPEEVEVQIVGCARHVAMLLRGEREELAGID